jgi:hypothetical protein
MLLLGTKSFLAITKLLIYQGLSFDGSRLYGTIGPRSIVKHAIACRPFMICLLRKVGSSTFRNIDSKVGMFSDGNNDSCTASFDRFSLSVDDGGQCCQEVAAFFARERT